MPVFDTRSGFHHLKLGSNMGYTTIHNINEICHWGIAYQLHKPKDYHYQNCIWEQSVHNTKIMRTKRVNSVEK